MWLFLQYFTPFKTPMPISKDQLFPFRMAMACHQCPLSGLGHCCTFVCHTDTGGQDLTAPQPVKARWWVPLPVKNSVSVSLIWLVQEGSRKTSSSLTSGSRSHLWSSTLTLARLPMGLDQSSSFTSYLTCETCHLTLKRIKHKCWYNIKAKGMTNVQKGWTNAKSSQCNSLLTYTVCFAVSTTAEAQWVKITFY